MNRLFSLSIRAQLLLIVFIVALPAAGIITYSGIKLRAEAIKDARRDTQKLAGNIAAEQQNMVAAAEQLVSALAQLPDVKKHHAAKVQPILKNILALNPWYSNIFIADRAGKVWASAVLAKPFNVSDRRYFINALATGRFSSGEYVISRTTTKPVFNFAYPIYDGRGETIGIISVGFVLDQFSNLIDYAELPPGTSYLLLDHKGVVLSRPINPKELVGKQYTEEPFKRMQEGPDEDTFVTRALDGIQRFITYRKLRLPGEQSPYMYIRAGIPVDVVLSKADRELLSNLLLLTSFFLAAFFLASLIGKRSIADRITLLEKASQRLASGDLQVRVSDLVAGGELGSLGRTFDSMVLQLAVREQDLQDKNRKLGQEVESRIRSEEAMRLSEERFEMIFDSVNDAILLQDPETGDIVDGNRKMIDMFGYTREEARRITMGDLSSGEPLYTQQDELAWIKRASSGKPQLFEWHCRHRSGYLFWCEVNMRIASIGGSERVLVVVRDITRRKLVEEKLHEIERRYRMLYETAGDAIFLVHGENFIDCNNKTLEMFGCAWEHILRQPLSRFSPPVQSDGRDSKEKTLEKIAEALAGEPQSFEWKFITYDGTPFDAEVNLNKIELPTRTYLQAIVRDITERKRSEEALKALVNVVNRSQKEWQDTFDSITDMIYIHDKNFTILKANKAYAAYLDFQPKEVFQKKCHALFPHGASSPMLGCSPQRTGDVAKPFLEEIVDAKTQRIFNVSTFPYSSPQGDIIGSIHIARDITDRKENELQLIMKERLASLGQMASGIAHEINNPLESVMISAEALLMRVDRGQYDQAIFKKYLQIVDDEVLRCREITGNMLSFARRTSVDRSSVDVHPVIDSALKLIGYQGRLKQVVVERVYQGRPLIRGNEGEFRQVIVALVVNALDAMENKGTLTIETGIQADNAYIKISDTGPGISRENLTKIFSPFFTTKAATGGTGLGLPIAQKIIASHQGSIQVVSEQGHGATFT
ncbi:MAG: PAS domain S-box protein, partial [Nitrospiraceae bacterium]|nr:PAS domain S-box protein [Nitrospiraceae bacterium]